MNVNLFKCLLLMIFLFGGCASNRKAESDGVTWKDKQSQDLESLRRSVETSFYREKELEERLVIAEERSLSLEKQLSTIVEGLNGVDARIDSLQNFSAQIDIAPKSNLVDRYRSGLSKYREEMYRDAQDIFEEVLRTAPKGEWADNAQYWKGECLYGLGEYRRALVEFTKIFAFSRTEKADDAQLKIARCYLKLQEQDKAISAFRKLLNEYPNSEYVLRARKELKHLGK
jgi:TolA-binding protein